MDHIVDVTLVISRRHAEKCDGDFLKRVKETLSAIADTLKHTDEQLGSITILINK